MKIPHILSLRQAVTLAIAALVLALFIRLFGPLVVGGLILVAAIAGAYAAAMKWAPEYIKPPK